MKNSIVLAFLVFLQITSQSEAFTVNCEFMVVDFYLVGEQYTCISIQNSSVIDHTVTEVTGTHLPGKINEDVTVILYYDSYYLTSFPRNFSAFFPSIIAFILDYSAIEVLNGDELNEFPQLQAFEIQNSALTVVPNGLFENTPNIDSIFLGYNRIERVGEELFTPLNVTQLLRVNFERNRCTNFPFATSQEEILALIEALRFECPSDGSWVDRTTTTPRWNGTTTSLPDWCYIWNVNQTICDLQYDVESMKNQVSSNKYSIDVLNFTASVLISIVEEHEVRISQLERQLVLRDEKIAQLEDEQKWMKEELMKLLMEKK